MTEYLPSEPSRIANAIFYALVILEQSPGRVGRRMQAAAVPAETMDTALRLAVMKGCNREEVDAVRTAYRLP